MRVVFTGAQGVGKSSVVERVIKHIALYNHRYQPSARERFISKNIPHSESATELTQREYLDHILSYAHDKDIVCDRGVFDVIGYTMDLCKRGVVTRAFLHEQLGSISVYRELVEDLVFFIRPEFEPIADGYRSIDPAYQRAISDNMESALNTFCVPYTILSGTIERRTELAMFEISMMHLREQANRAVSS